MVDAMEKGDEYECSCASKEQGCLRPDVASEDERAGLDGDGVELALAVAVACFSSSLCS